MISILKNSAIVAGVLAAIAYAVYRYMKGCRNTPITYESILKSAISHIKEGGVRCGEYDLVIFPPSKANAYLYENKDFFNNVNISDISNKKLVIWFIQQEDNVLYQETLLSDSLASDFTDVVPSDKIYRKKIKIS